MEFIRIWNGKKLNMRPYYIPATEKDKNLRMRSKSDLEYQVVKKIKETIGYKGKQTKDDGVLRNYQIMTIDECVKNKYRGLFTITAGTGKTFTVLECINRFQKNQGKTITIIACPQTHLVGQWKLEVNEYNNLNMVDRKGFEPLIRCMPCTYPTRLDDRPNNQ